MDLFYFFSKFRTIIGSDELKERCEQLANVYRQGPNHDYLLIEFRHLKNYIHAFDDDSASILFL